MLDQPVPAMVSCNRERNLAMQIFWVCLVYAWNNPIFKNREVLVVTELMRSQMFMVCFSDKRYKITKLT